MGTPEFAVPSLQALLAAGHEVDAVVSQPDRARGRGGVVTSPPVKLEAQRHGLLILQPERIRSQEALDRLRRIAPDLAVVVAYGQILPRSVLSIPRLGCLNVHASLLPRYRGAAPIHWAIINGEAETGVTTMWMDEGMDTGPTALQAGTAVAWDETVGSLHDRLAVLGADLLVETIRRVGNGTCPRIPQDEALATRAPLLRPEDEIIRWDRPARAIRDHIRGMNPWPVAHTTAPEGRLKLWAARPADPLARAGGRPPGEVLAADSRGILVQAGQGQLWLTEVQPPGGRRMPADAYARGRAITPGIRFGG